MDVASAGCLTTGAGVCDWRLHDLRRALKIGYDATAAGRLTK